MGATDLTRRDNFVWMLYALILLLFSGATVEQLQLDNAYTLINLSLTLTLLVAVWSMEKNRGWLHSRLGLSLVIAGIALGDYFLESAGFELIHVGFILTFLVVTLVLAARQVLFSGVVDGNKIVGAICIFILMGLVWAFSYLLVEMLFPGSMSGFPSDYWQDNLQPAIYYSFVTLTTLGYGEITPVQPLARFLAYSESLTGQFYIAILVASLIGIRLSSIKPGTRLEDED